MIIAEFHQVLTPSECSTLIEHGKKSLTELKVVGSDNKDKYRYGDGTWVYNSIFTPEGIDLNQKIKKIVAEKTNMPIENQENVHIVHYGIGGEYKEHHDFFHSTSGEYNSHVARGGQRKYSLLFYLNEGFKGGETRFVRKNITVTANTGKLLMWSNMKEDGHHLEYDSKHAGLPVIEGEKWIAIVWVRQYKFG